MRLSGQLDQLELADGFLSVAQPGLINRGKLVARALRHFVRTSYLQLFTSAGKNYIPFRFVGATYAIRCSTVIPLSLRLVVYWHASWGALDCINQYNSYVFPV
jgi:hypothetical protein